eukprot:TRINITY_DN5237_c0_g1_i1.p1 TRINITY_DN5237_c0_g1~~TRINITY_DN5237_c0_g1_i1.p1  ORF type:complete len:481 (+),score=85.64 TRINITY_DN5237_c0_g1_i1:261-1703(+)
MGNQQMAFDQSAQKQKWLDNGTAMLPCSPEWQVKIGKKKYITRWEHTKNVLTKHSQITSVEQLEEVIGELNSTTIKFPGLSQFISNFSEEERKAFFERILPYIIKSALRLADLFPEPVRLLTAKPPESVKTLLKDGENERSLKLTRAQIVSLISHAFLCNFPPEQQCKGELFPDPNFSYVHSVKDMPHQLAKFRHLVHYFDRLAKEEASTESLEGVISFHRLVVSQPPNWSTSTKPLRKMTVYPRGYIEDAENSIQVDFANKCIGGGVLQTGCVQEEIRFSVNTELLASMIFTSYLTDNEALLMIGSQRYSKYEGYGRSWRYEGDYVEKAQVDSEGHLLTPIVAIDAVPYGARENLIQFEQNNMLRELVKAYAGFQSLDTKILANQFPIATGNWGCGVFGGDVQLKSLLQWLAASEGEREVLYYAFGDKCSEQLQTLASRLKERGYTVSRLWNLLLQYKPRSDHKNISLFDYIESMEPNA